MNLGLNLRSKTKIRCTLLLVLVLLSFLVYILINKDISVDELKLKYTNQSSKFMEINGMQVHYRDEGKGMPIVLIHGTGASLHTWNDWTTKLKENYRVIRMDLPAFGLTGPHPKRDYSIDSYTDFLHDFLSKLQIDSLYLAGNSLGGNITWNYAADHPKRVKKMILIDASGHPSEKESPWIFSIAKIPILNKIIRYVTPRSIIKNNLEQVYFDDQKVTEELITRYYELALREGNRQAFIDRINTAYIDHTQKLKNLNVKSLVLWGADDQWIPIYQGQKFLKDLPYAKLVVLDGTGHVPMEETPDESLQKAIDFFQE